MIETIYNLRFEDANMTAWFLLRQVNKLMSRTLARSLRKHGINPEQLMVLWICRDYPERKTLAEISRLLSLTSQTVTGMINRMEIDDLVGRVPRRKGHPFTEIKLTAKGEEVYSRGIPILQAAFKGAPHWLTALQLTHLNSLLKMLRDGLAQDLHIEVEPVQGWDSKGGEEQSYESAHRTSIETANSGCQGHDQSRDRPGAGKAWQRGKAPQH